MVDVSLEGLARESPYSQKEKKKIVNMTFFGFYTWTDGSFEVILPIIAITRTASNFDFQFFSCDSDGATNGTGDIGVHVVRDERVTLRGIE